MLRVGVMSRCNELVFQVHRRKKLKCKGQFVLHEEWHNNVKVVRLVAFWLYHFLQTKCACAHCPREVVHIRTSKPSCLGKCMAVHTRVQLSPQAKSEITSLVSQALSSFRSFALHNASDSESLETRILIQYSL